MPQVHYTDVPLVRQEANPICWVASCAMLESWGTKSSVGVGKYTGGFDPSNSSIPNPADNWSKCVDLMTSWGFKMYATKELAADSTTLTLADLNTILSGYGPIILLHLCQGFPYGKNWADSSTMKGAHAVVLTGVDVDNNIVWFNNPWGDLDQTASASTILQHMNSDASMGKTIGAWPGVKTGSSTSSSGTTAANDSSSQGTDNSTNSTNSTDSTNSTSPASSDTTTDNQPVTNTTSNDTSGSQSSQSSDTSTGSSTDATSEETATTATTE